MAETLNTFSPSDALGSSSGQAPAPTGVAGFLANPNVQSLLGGIAARLDPYGVGGALGGAVQEHVNNMSQQRVAKKDQSRHGDWLSGLQGHMKSMSADGKSLLTPPGEQGYTGIKMKPDGSYSLDVNGPGPQRQSPEDTGVTETPLATPAPTATDTAAASIAAPSAIPSATTVSGPVTPTASNSMAPKPKAGTQFSDLIPF